MNPHEDRPFADPEAAAPINLSDHLLPSTLDKHPIGETKPPDGLPCRSSSSKSPEAQKIVQRMRKEIGLPVLFTLDACRHGGMTELEEAELTEGQGRALSAHRTRES
jgi:hypothetical protein